MTASASADNKAFSPPGGLVLSCAILLAVMLMSTAVVVAWLGSLHGTNGVYAGLVGSLICTFPATVALVISAYFAGTQNSLNANLGVMLLRMGVPLVGLAMLPQQLPTLAASGLSTAILSLYLVALLSETLLALRHVPKQSPKSVPALSSGSTHSVEAR